MMMIMMITIIVTPFASPVLSYKSDDTDDKDEDCDDNYHRSILGIISAG